MIADMGFSRSDSHPPKISKRGGGKVTKYSLHFCVIKVDTVIFFAAVAVRGLENGPAVRGLI